MIRRIFLVGVIVLGLFALLWYSQHRTSPRKVSGFVEADSIRLGSRVGGRVQRVLVEEGERVEVGQPLIELEPYDLLEREREAVNQLAVRQATLDKLTSGFRVEEINQAKAHFDQLEARLKLLENGPRKEEIEAAREREEAAQAELLLAQSTFNRAKQLYMESRAISQEEYDKSLLQLKAARALALVRQNEYQLLKLGTRKEELEEAQAKLREAKAAWDLMKAGYRIEEIDQAKAERDSAKATLAAVRVQLKELVICSPVKGFVEALELRPGDLVVPSAPVISLLDHSKMWIRAYVPENELDLALGQKLRVEVDSYPDRIFAGELSFISRSAEFTPSNIQTPEERSKQVFRIKVRIQDGHEQLRPGMIADVWLTPFPS